MSSPMSGDRTLDKVVSYCLSHQIETVSVDTVPIRLGRKRNIVRVGNIAFNCHGHDTGADVGGWIIDGSESYQFLSGTYWYNSCYTFNEFKWENGAWDGAVARAINHLWEKADEHHAKAEARRESQNSLQSQQAAERKACFERQFL